MYREEENVVSIKGRRSLSGAGAGHADRNGSIPRRDRPQSKMRRNLSTVVAFILIGLIVLLTIKLFTNENEKISYYEVRSAQLSYDTTFKGIAVRDERLIYADYSGYVSYFVRNKKKCAKNSVIYCVDSGRNTFNALKKDFANDKLDKSQIKEIKASIARYLEGDSTTIIGNISDFNEQLGSMIYDFVSNNMIENLKDYVNDGLTGSSFHVFRSPYSGVVSFKCDAYNGITSDMVTADMFNSAPSIKNLRSTGLISSADPVYRICEDENWSIVCKVTEEFFVDNVARSEANVLIGNKTTPVRVSMSSYSIDKDYFVEIRLNNYMSEFLDDRLLSVRFINDRDNGLKIPASAVVQKDYYLVPLNMFVEDRERNIMLLKKETVDEATGEIYLTSIYPSKYYSDGYYAYIDSAYVTAGDIINNPETGSRIRVSTMNSLDGVYNVNKGFYQFVRIDRIETGSDYIVISPTTPDGIREYDHIALDGSLGFEGKMIK